jgi:cobalt-zinc-cadmium resistance protein CzcA
MDRELEKIPGALWNFSQPIADNMEEAVSGVKGELAIKIYGDDLKGAGSQGRRDRRRHAHGPGHRGPRPVPRDRPAQPEFTVDRARPRASESTWPTCRTPSRPPSAARPSPRCCRASSATTWWCAIRRPTASTREAIENIRLLRPSGERVSLAQLASRGARWRIGDLPGSQFALRGHQVQRARPRPGQHGGRGHEQGDPAGESCPRATTSIGPASTRARSARRSGWHDCAAGHHSGDFPDSLHHVPGFQVGDADSGQRGHGADRRDCWRCYLTHTHFSVSSGVGFLALFGVSVQTGVIMLEYINQLRARGFRSWSAADGAVLRLRPIMMTMLVASAGPAAGGDVARHRLGFAAPFAIVIVGGLMAALMMSIFLLPSRARRAHSRRPSRSPNGASDSRWAARCWAPFSARCSRASPATSWAAR